MLQMMLRPRWIGALLLALLAAAIFAFLAQWQIGRAATEAIVHERPTETVQPLASGLRPGVATPQSATGQRFVSSGAFQAGDTEMVPDRIQNLGDKTPGWWVVAHFVTTDQIDIPVVIGWAPSEATANAAVETFDSQIVAGTTPTNVTGRFLPSDAPEVPKGNPQTLTGVSIAQLINVWHHVSEGGVYFGYLIDEHAQAGLAVVSTPAPEQQAQLNWLNLFYGLEWTLFAGFAVFFWFRLVKDAVEREREEAEQSAASADS